MLGVIVNYVGSHKHQKPFQYIIKPERVSSKNEAAKLIGKKVQWKQPKSNKAFIGKIIDVHGNNGAVRVRFNKGLPGQAIGSSIQIFE
ncbi:MAG: 50S ribosomal protein L35ae [Euryarchaeota archaeon]|nr:50S ribosomal protein L35ae [Euryarchaeota archaeon]